MDGPDLWDALRERGVDADDPDVRASVRTTFDAIDDVRERHGDDHARRCTHAVAEALAYVLSHPDTSDMGSFEDEFEGDGE